MKVISKQKNSEMCVICGMNNKYGLRAPFYNMEDNSVMTKFKYEEFHQSYPGRVHGGLITAMLDELGLRAYWVENEEDFAVTMKLNTEYRKPVPYNEELIGVGRIIKSTPKFIKAEAKILDIYGNTLANAEGTYIKLDTEKIVDASALHENMIFLIEDNVKEINFEN